METNLLETAPPCAPKPNGRPPYKPSEAHGGQVKFMAGFGIPQDQIAKFLHISAPTLRKHYREQLDLSAIEANTNVLSSLYQMATTRHSPAAAIFWAKSRCGFRTGGDPPELSPKTHRAPDRSPKPFAELPPKRSALEGLTAELNDGAPNGDF